jgi:hypothetical protein
VDGQAIDREITLSALRLAYREYAGAGVLGSRGLPGLLTQGSRTRPGLHSVAREYAGSDRRLHLTQGSRTRPGLLAVARE